MSIELGFKAENYTSSQFSLYPHVLCACFAYILNAVLAFATFDACLVTISVFVFSKRREETQVKVDGELYTSLTKLVKM